MTDIAEANIRRLDGALLLVFRELMRQRRATLAADRLGLSQSGVSHALARLREVFGDPLFLRRPHGLEPTRRALELAPKIDALIALAQEAVGREAVFDPARSNREFHIGSTEYLMPLLAAPLLHRMEAEAPGASVVFKFLLADEALAALKRGEIDLALGSFTEMPEGVRQELLFSDYAAVVARAGHPALQGSMTLETFASLGHVLVAPTGERRADPRLTALGVHRKVVAVVPRFLTAFAVVGSTDAIVMAPRPLARRYAEGFGLQVMDPPFEAAELEVSAIRRDGPPADPGIDWLLSRIREAASVD